MKFGGRVSEKRRNVQDSNFKCKRFLIYRSFLVLVLVTRSLCVLTLFIYVHDQNVWWLIELPFWFKAGFCLKFWEFCIHNMKNIILGEARFNPCVVRLSQRLVNSKNWNFETLWIFRVFWCLVQSKVEKDNLVKSSLHQVRLMPGQIDGRWNLRVTSVILPSLIFLVLTTGRNL